MIEPVNQKLLERAGIIIPPTPNVRIRKWPVRIRTRPEKKRWAENGLCMHCGKPRDVIGVLCKYHREYGRRYQQWRRDNGLD